MRIPALAEGAPVDARFRVAAAPISWGRLCWRQPCGASPPRNTLYDWLPLDFIMKLGIPLASFSMHVTQTQSPRAQGPLVAAQETPLN